MCVFVCASMFSSIVFLFIRLLDCAAVTAQRILMLKNASSNPGSSYYWYACTHIHIHTYLNHLFNT